MDFEELAARYRQNLFESVIPFWERHSLDPVHGGQFNCLERDGQVFDTRKYVWMQGRAVWMFSRLYNTVERRPAWLAAARSILDFLLAHGRAPDGRFYFSVSREGLPVFIQRKPYAAFFAALALLEFAKTGATGERAYFELALELAEDVERAIADPSLLGRPVLSGATPVRQLADIMVLAALAIERIETSYALGRNPQPLWFETLRQLLAQVREHWLAEKKTLLENFPLDGSPYHASADTRLLCPGSALEVAWFLLHAIELLDARCGENHRDAETFLYEVIAGTLEAGWDMEYGGLFYFLDANGHPPLILEADMKLWWPHTEAIYALLLAYTKTQDPKWLPWLERIDRYAFQTFVDREYGEWFAYCDRSGRPTHTLKAGPYKCFFHVPRCLLFSLKRLEKIPAKTSRGGPSSRPETNKN
ncbi:MAG: AGE family epimerase/isomerase [Bryobacteraceae bacterium]|nr:AGE family epimerase/isomerase [Bryobacteraceae bacterium]MDW8378331.1 AGE family epimerase/isomerase [Bryobacterales bacterium]